MTFRTISLLALAALLSLPPALPGGGALGVARAQEQPDGPRTEVHELAQALRLPEVLTIMRDEGMGYGDDLEAELFPGLGGRNWQATVAQIYDPGRIETRFMETFTSALTAGQVREILTFFQSERGQRIVSLEIAARQALLDESVEEASRAQLNEMMAADAPRLALIREFADANELVEQNVAGALNSNLAFYNGMIEGGAFEEQMTEDQVLADVWSQESVIREETTEWLLAYLAMAYRPLSDEDLRAYLEFSRSPAGQALNRAMFAGFDDIFTTISYDLGRETARYLSGHDI